MAVLCGWFWGCLVCVFGVVVFTWLWLLLACCSVGLLRYLLWLGGWCWLIVLF